MEASSGTKLLYIRRLEDLVHSLGTEGALHEITNGDGADEGGETGILTLLLGGAFLEDLGGIEGLQRACQWATRLGEGGVHARLTIVDRVEELSMWSSGGGAVAVPSRGLMRVHFEVGRWLSRRSPHFL